MRGLSHALQRKIHFYTGLLMDRGFVILWRKFWDDPDLKTGEPFTPREAWLYLFSNLANGIERNGIPRGEFQVSERFLSKKWLWDKSKVHRFLVMLEKTGKIKGIKRNEVSVNHLSNHQPNQETNHFIICKYDTYQNTRTADRTTNRTTFRTKSKEGIKESTKERTNIPTPSEQSDFKKFIEEEYERIRNCKLYSDRSDWISLANLQKKSNGDLTTEKLQIAWTCFLESPKPYHREQGHPLRFWCSNINAFIGVHKPQEDLEFL
jgi:hypothetical protein